MLNKYITFIIIKKIEISRVAKGNLMLRHSVSHVLLNSEDIPCLVAELRALPRHQSEEMKKYM